MKKLIVFAIIFLPGLLMAQQDPMLSQYMLNGLFLNPAYSGTRPYFSSSIVHRRQWTGFEGAPKTSLLGIDGPILDNKMGVGLIIANDKTGVVSQSDIYANYSYQFKMGPGYLSMGAKAGVSQYSATISRLVYWDKNDGVFQNDRVSEWLPKFGLGFYYYTDRLYAGFSVPALLAYDPKYDFKLDVNESSRIRRHYYLNAGYVFNAGKDFKIKPSFLLKYLPAAPFQADINTNVLYKECFWLGFSIRTGDALVILTEYQLNKHIRLGYAFDYTISRLNAYSGGTHEVMIGYDFGRDLVKIKTPRYF